MGPDPHADLLVLDDRAAPADGALPWRFFTDAVMGGLSTGSMTLAIVDGRPAVCLHGEVRLERNGGFVQIALEVPPNALAGGPPWIGIEIDLRGNGRRYGVHLRTRELAAPWQAYRATVEVPPHWQRLRLPFGSFTPHRTSTDFDARSLSRIGLVAIGERFTAHACVARLALYR